LRKEPWEMFVAHKILHDPKCVMYTDVSQGTAIFVSEGEECQFRKRKWVNVQSMR
jgi:hypothetical protein